MKQGHIVQTKENRDAVREGGLLPDLYARLNRVYQRHGLPGLAIWAHNRDNDLAEEISDLDHHLAETAGATRLLLGFKILADGHAANLGEAADLAADDERVRELYPEAFR